MLERKERKKAKERKYRLDLESDVTEKHLQAELSKQQIEASLQREREKQQTELNS